MPKRRSSRLVLTRYPGAAAAYSTRLLNTAYTGAALRVRRSNDNAETDIGFIAGNLDESALTAFVGANSAFVTTWYDQSGNGRNATQATAANQPRIVNAGVVDKRNGRITPVFNGTSTSFSTAPIPFTGDKLFYVDALNLPVSSPVAVVYEHSVNYNNNSGSIIKTVNSTDGGYAFGKNINAAGALLSPNNSALGFKVSSAQFDISLSGIENEIKPKINSVAETYVVSGNGADQTGNFITQPVYIGARAGTSLFFNGSLPELLVWNSDQSTNRVAIEANILLAYFGPARLLNDYAGAAVAYSTRLLDRFYQGPAIRVRRSNDNAELDIGFDSNGNLNEAALTAFVGANSAFVTTWYDQSGNARPATQTTAANQPRIVNAGVVDKVNGRVSVRFLSATQTLLQTASNFTIAQPDSLFFCAAHKSDVTDPFVFDGATSANRQLFFYETATNAQQANAGVALKNTVLGKDELFKQYSIVFNSTQSSWYKNGILSASGDAGTSNLTGLTLGNRFSTLPNTPLNDVVTEFILYPSNQSANRAAIESNIMSYFGITA